MQERGEDAARAGAHRFSIVTSGRHTGKTETTTIATAVENMSKLPVQRCASLGVLDVGALQSLKRRGLQTYHHNLEAARSFYGSIVGTRTYDDNLATINAARDAGLRICSGGIFGMGESWEQRIELLTEMARLDVDGVPINFLVPIPGTPLSDQPLLPPWEALRIIALARLMMPAVDIIIAGGREPVLGDQQHQIFRAGASSMMVGNYLTTSGRCLEDDLEMIAACGLRLEGKL
jgi:biotin synthase